MRSITVDATPRARITAMLRDYDEAPNDADIDIHIGSLGDKPAVIISISGNFHGLSVDEVEPAIKIAESAAETLKSIGVQTDFSNLILAIRHGANVAKKQ